jgi:TonB family protein
MIARKMKMRKLVLIAVFSALLPMLSVQVQSTADDTKHFEKSGLEFDYPGAWKTAEGHDEDSQYVELATADKATQLIVSWQYGAVLDCEREAARIRVTQALVERVATQIHATAPPATSWQETRLGKTRADQIQLRGQLNNTPVLADVYSLAVKSQFLNLVYLRVADDQTGNSVWETIRTTLKFTPPAPLPAGHPGDGGVLNGKAIRLPSPSYPAGARNAGASGVVVVQVLIDERGRVIAACAVAGHPLLRDSAVAAARGALFTPTKLSGKPVRVTGVVTYNFVRIGG